MDTSLKYLDINNLYGYTMSQKLPVSCFKWVKNRSQCTEGFIKTMVKIVI